MPLTLLLIAAALLVSPADAQERWRQLPGGAAAYSVDVHSLAFDAGVLRARVRTLDVASIFLVEELEVRCSMAQLRTVSEQRYDRDSGRLAPAARPEPPHRDVAWAEYVPGSEGHALLSSLCHIARERGLSEPTEHSRA
jgi:hypothetical protein